MFENRCVKLSNGTHMPVIALGVWQLKNDECSTAVQSALKSGVRLIDTASAYNNEEFVREGIEAYATLGNSVDDVFVTSKLNPKEMGYENALEACERSLKKLGRDYLDLYLVHFPAAADKPHSDDAHRELRLKTWQAMEELYRKEKVKAVGVSNFHPRHIKGMEEDGIEVLPMVNQIELHPLCQTLMRDNKKEYPQIVIQSYSPLGCGDTSVLEHAVLTEIAKKKQRTVPQVVLRWLVQSDLTVAFRSRSEKHISENIQVYDFELSADEIKAINGLDTDNHFCWNSKDVK